VRRSGRFAVRSGIRKNSVCGGRRRNSCEFRYRVAVLVLTSGEELGACPVHFAVVRIGSR